MKEDESIADVLELKKISLQDECLIPAIAEPPPSGWKIPSYDVHSNRHYEPSNL
jgi:hypothetical protein